jgi:hypothetical protein
MKDPSNTCYACFHLFLFFKLKWIRKLVIIIKLIQYWLIGWLMFGSLSFPWQIFNTYSGNNKITEQSYKGRERNSLTYKYYIEIQTVRIFTWQFSIERVSISATVESTMQGLSAENWKPSHVQFISSIHYWLTW